MFKMMIRATASLRAALSCGCALALAACQPAPDAAPNDTVEAASLSPFHAIVSMRTNVNRPPTLGYALSTHEHDVAFDGTNYLVVWQDTRSISGYRIGIMGARVSAAGVVLDKAGFTIFEHLVNASIPSVAFDGTNFVVAAMDSSGSVRVNRVSSAGVVLDGTYGREVDRTSGYVDVLDVASGSGVSLVTWTDHLPGSGSMRGRLFSSAGTPLGTTLYLSSTSNDNVPSVSWNGTQFLVAWRRGNTFGSGPVVAVRVSADGTILDATPIALGTAPSDRLSVSAAGRAGTWLVAWPSASGLVAARISNAGAVLDATPVKLSPASWNAGFSAAASATDFYVTWLADLHVSTANLMLNRVSAAGAVLDGAGVVLKKDVSFTAPSSACSASDCLALWSSQLDVFGARVRGSAALDSRPLHVSAAASRQYMPAIARAGSQYLIVWEDYRTGTDKQIYAARMNLNGVVLDPGGIPICTAVGDQLEPRVAGTAAGDFFVVWADKRAGVTTYVDVYGTRVLASGTVVTPDGVRLTTSDDASSPVIASDGSGYLLAWYESSAPGINNVVEASRMTAAGVLLDSPPLHLTPRGGGANPTVTFGAGSYFVAFGSAGVRGVRIPPAGAPLDAPPGFPIGPGTLPSATFDGRNYVVGYLRYESTSGSSSASDYVYATRVAPSGTVLDAAGVKLSSTPLRGYSSSWYRQGPEASFDGADSVFTWSSSFDGAQLFSGWLSPAGVAFAAGRPSTLLVNVPSSIPLSPAIAGRGDGDHSLLVYAYGDTTPGVRNFRVGSQVVTFQVDGRSCAANDECKSGYCVDGVCCSSACGGGAVDCQACSRAAGAASDGTCGPVKAGAVCRPAAGPCDVKESCTGTSPLCPANASKPDGTACSGGMCKAGLCI